MRRRCRRWTDAVRKVIVRHMYQGEHDYLSQIVQGELFFTIRNQARKCLFHLDFFSSL